MKQIEGTPFHLAVFEDEGLEQIVMGSNAMSDKMPINTWAEHLQANMWFTILTMIVSVVEKYSKNKIEEKDPD